jgi:hypothetical protein
VARVALVIAMLENLGPTGGAICSTVRQPGNAQVTLAPPANSNPIAHLAPLSWRTFIDEGLRFESQS